MSSPLGRLAMSGAKLTIRSLSSPPRGPASWPRSGSRLGAHCELAGTELDERWPVSYALRFIVMVSIGLWAVIMAAASWLLG